MRLLAEVYRLTYCSRLGCNLGGIGLLLGKGSEERIRGFRLVTTFILPAAHSHWLVVDFAV